MKQSFDANSYITHHIQDGQEWSIFPFLPTIQIPDFFSLHGVMLLCAGLILFIIFGLLYDKKSRVPGKFTNCLEVLIIYVRDEITIPNLGQEDGRKLLPFTLTLFFFILTLNLMGLIPIFATATANISVTAGLALVTLFYMSVMAMRRNGVLKFCKSFVPSGLPLPIIPLIIALEILGLLIKPVALTLRLLANMLAGHIVILSLVGVVVTSGVLASPLLGLALFMYLIEVMVAFLQAYVFTLLTVIFVGQMYHPSH